MSYDRVLPKPAALYYDPARNNLPRRPTSSLLEHKIMNDQPSKVAVADRADGGSNGPSSSKYGADPATPSTALSQAHLSSANREKVALNEISSSASLTRKRVAPLLTEDISLQCRSSSSSPSKSMPSKEPVQFCLCQPDPKIPRPRNGESSFSISLSLWEVLAQRGDLVQTISFANALETADSQSDHSFHTLSTALSGRCCSTEPRACESRNIEDHR